MGCLMQGKKGKSREEMTFQHVSSPTIWSKYWSQIWIIESIERSQNNFSFTTCTKLNTKIKKLLSNFGLQNYKTYKNSISTLKGIWFHCGCHINRSLVDIWRPTDNKCIGFQQVIFLNFSTIVDFPINWVLWRRLKLPNRYGRDGMWIQVKLL